MGHSTDEMSNRDIAEADLVLIRLSAKRRDENDGALDGRSYKSRHCRGGSRALGFLSNLEKGTLVHSTQELANNDIAKADLILIRVSIKTGEENDRGHCRGGSTRWPYRNMR